MESTPLGLRDIISGTIVGILAVAVTVATFAFDNWATTVRTGIERSASQQRIILEAQNRVLSDLALLRGELSAAKKDFANDLRELQSAFDRLLVTINAMQQSDERQLVRQAIMEQEIRSINEELGRNQMQQRR